MRDRKFYSQTAFEIEKVRLDHRVVDNLNFYVRTVQGGYTNLINYPERSVTLYMESTGYPPRMLQLNLSQIQ
jgi:hypothetical protein